MQIALKSNLITGTFIKELKNRFLCEVNIDGNIVICYVPSSCHLSNFLQLEGKQVLLTPTESKGARTKFSVFAIRYKQSYIILNSSIANKAVISNLSNRRFAFLGKRKKYFKEHTVSNYKSDIFISDTNSIIEVKSVISTDTTAIFPTVYSERALIQLRQLQKLLSEGLKVYLFVVSLNPYVKEIKLNENTEFSNELKKCLEEGMVLKAYSCKLNDDRIRIQREVKIEL
ncbi:MAG: DNA/RNA nuclease SfsA [Ruminococcus sp.]|nr:DNA/RNA nuclease SfsA [Ruminococcus sp.]